MVSSHCFFVLYEFLNLWGYIFCSTVSFSNTEKAEKDPLPTSPFQGEEKECSIADKLTNRVTQSPPCRANEGAEEKLNVSLS